MNLLRTREAVKTYHVSKESLRRWVRQGVLSEIRTPGGHRLYIREELERLMFRRIANQRVAGQN
jgi:excisionase family DNA binding protein